MPANLLRMEAPGHAGPHLPRWAGGYVTEPRFQCSLFCYLLNAKCTTFQPKLYNRCHTTWGGHRTKLIVILAIYSIYDAGLSAIKILALGYLYIYLAHATA